MIALEGRVLPGLDEFMLRCGHLVTLARVAHQFGTSKRRLRLEMARVLSAEVPVSESSNSVVAEYLSEKKLCRDLTGTLGEPQSKAYRYPRLEIDRSGTGELVVRSPGNDAILISWQDRNLSHRAVRSRVGAITSGAKSGSKTGLSHIEDWAGLLEITNSAGQLSANFRLAVGLCGALDCDLISWNPYVFGNERLFIAYEYFRRDMDLFARMAPRLLCHSRLTKADCQGLFVEALTETSKEAEQSRGISSRQKFEIHSQLRELERASRIARRKGRDASTAWHRAASRVELYTDLGLLEKARHSERDKYRYVYFPTPALGIAIESLGKSESLEQWLGEYLVEVVLGIADKRAIADPTTALDDLRRIVTALAAPTTLLPIDSLALGLVFLSAERGSALSLLRAREALESLPNQEPDIARLARGRTGSRAEFISINFTKLGRGR